MLATPAPQRTVTLPVFLDRFYLGDALVSVSSDFRPETVETARIASLLEDRVNDEFAGRIDALAQSSPMAPFDAFAAAVPGLDVTYDEGDLRLVVSLGVQATRLMTIAANDDGYEPPPKTGVERPSRFAALAAFSASSEFVHEAQSAPLLEGTLRTTIAATGSVSFGGIGRPYIVGDAFYSSTDDRGFSRGFVAAFVDDARRAVRYAAGEFAAPSVGFQSSPTLAGISVARNYTELQPVRNVRPGGRSEIVLEQPSTVDVLLNGQSVRSLRLPPGRYRIEDFGFAEGANDVQLIVTDEAGRREVASLSTFFAQTLLEPGVSEFAVSVGVEADPGLGGVEYGSEVQALANYRRGLSDALTMGAYAQATSEEQVVGAEADVATALGTLRLEAAASAGEAAGYALTAGSRTVLGDDSANRVLETQVVVFSERFAAPGGSPSVRMLESDIRIRFNMVGGSATVGVSYDMPQDGSAGQFGANASYTRSFGRLNTAVTFDRRTNPRTFEDEMAVFASLSLRFGRRNLARSSYQSDTASTRLQLQRLIEQRLYEFGYNVEVRNSAERGNLIDADAEFLSNRARLAMRVNADETIDGARDVRSTATFQAAIGLANGIVGYGRPPGDAFAIVRRHPTLQGADISVGRTFVGAEMRRQAKVDALGPALIPLEATYRRLSLDFEAENAPPGYAFESTRFQMYPGRASGYGLTAGSARAITGIGVLVDRDGAPIPLIAGRAIGQDDRGQPFEVEFFTNRDGRFVAERLAAGRYTITLADGRRMEAAFSVPPRQRSGLLELGRVQIYAK